MPLHFRTGRRAGLLSGCVALRGGSVIRPTLCHHRLADRRGGGAAGGGGESGRRGLGGVGKGSMAWGFAGGAGGALTFGRPRRRCGSQRVYFGGGQGFAFLCAAVHVL